MGKKTRRQTAPAEGERAAIAGYHPQYLLSADTILQSLRHETMEWIRIADPEAGRVDDFQIGTQGRVDGYQVKWSRDGGNFTFRDLTIPETDKPCLIAQLADGWMALQRNNPNRRVVVHLRTNTTPSVTKLLELAGDGGSGSFSEFLSQVWYPAHETGNPIPAGWQPVWDTLVQASTLNATEFERFVSDCELEFGVPLPGRADAAARKDPIFERDLRQLTEFLQEAVASPEKIVELSCAALLGGLNWTHRLTYASRHEFPDPTIPYREIEATASRLRVSLQNVSRGYLAVLGDPGSGKSTLLTKTLIGLPYRLIRYYAFIPDSSDPRILRGEATSFLHDITLDLDRCGFRPGRSISDTKDAEQLAQRLHKQLRLLHEEWQATGCKTVILVDGLDHIPRELKPSNTLLRYLPPPDQIPDGVVIVLGSQTDELADLPHIVQLAIRNRDRRIEIERLSRESVVEIVRDAGLPVALNASQLTEVEKLVAGHPLALALLVNRLSDLAVDETVDAILASTEPFGGQIDEVYYSHWRHVVQDREDSDLAALLGKLVRLRPTLDMGWIESWAGPAVVLHLRRNLYHLFRREGRDRWYIFHNSFRQFLLQRTAESPPDGFDEERDRRIHTEIADLCAAEPPESCWNWEEAYHRHRAGQHREAIDLANAEQLRSQLLACRPIDSIQGDVRTAIASAGELRDFVSVVRLLFVAAEFQSREEAISAVLLPELLLGTNETEKAFANIRDGRRLRLTAQAALDLIPDLMAMGCREEARLVFELAEPVDLLKGPQKEPGLQREQVTLLDSWAESAASFRPIAEIVRLVRGTRCYADPWHRDSDPSGKILALQNRMLYYVGEGLIGLSNWGDLESLIGELNESDSRGTDEHFWLCVRAWEACYARDDLPRGRTFVDRAAAIVAAGGDDEKKVRLAEGVLRLVGDPERARDLLGTTTAPRLASDDGFGERLGPYMLRFRYSRLLYALGEKRSAAELIPDVSEARWQGAVLFERGISEIARIWAMSWRGILLNGPTFVRETALLLRLFSRSWDDDVHARWRLLTRHRSEFYSLLVQCAKQHGAEAVTDLASAFAKEWFEGDRRCWPLDDIRAITREFYRAGAEKRWCCDILEWAERESSDDTTTTDRVSWRESQAKGWILLGEAQRACVLLDQMLTLSAGIGYRKDYQLDSLIEWMRMANRAQPEAALDRVHFLASAVISMVESTEGRAATSAAEVLLKAAFESSPRRATSLCRLLSENGVIGYASAAGLITKCAAEAANSSCEICLIYCADLLIPISASSDGPLVRAIIERLGRARGSEAAKGAAYLLLNAVNIYGLPETRAGWRRGIREGLGELNISFDGFEIGEEPRADSDEGSPDKLRLDDGRELSRHDVEAVTRTADDLCSFIRAEAGGSYFDWSPNIRELAGRMTAVQVVALAASLKLRRREAIGIAALAERLCDLGDRPRAWGVALQAVACAEQSGWDRYYDGGSMQAAFRALVKIDPDRARPRAFGAFIEHLTGEWWYPQNVVINLHDIAPILVETVPVTQIWSIIEDYLRALFSHVPPINATVLNLAETQTDSAPRAIAELTCDSLGHPAHLLSEGAIRTCTDLLLAGNADIQIPLREALQQPGARGADALIVLDAASRNDATIVSAFADHIDALRRSPDQSIRWAAARIGDRLGLPAIELPVNPETLAHYRGRVIASGVKQLYGRAERSSFETIRDSDDKYEMVSPLLDDVRLIAGVAGISFESVLVRVVEFMRGLTPESTWNAEAEGRLRQQMNSAELRFPFRRPRPSQARRAIFHVLAELADSGRLTTEDLVGCERLLRRYDPDLVIRRPVARPGDIAPVTRPDHTEFKKEWVEAVCDGGFRPLCPVCDGRVVLAECTTLKPAGNPMPTEFRKSVIVPRTVDCPVPEVKHSRFFPPLIRELTACYHIESADLEEFPVVANWAYGYDTPGEGWLALNPTLGRSLGWAASEKAFLAWEQDVRLTVETIWWNDGCLGNPLPFYAKGEVAEGWLVVATDDALKQIAARMGPLKRIGAVTRELYQDRSMLRQTRYFDAELTGEP